MYTLKVHNIICQLYLYKTGKKILKQNKTKQKQWAVMANGKEFSFGGDRSGRKSKFSFGNG